MKKFLSLFAALLFLGVTQMWGENLTKTEGFETKAAGTNYQSTVTISEEESDCGIGWSIYYGTVSTNDKISGSNSAQMRYYSNKDDRGYVQSTTAVEGLSNVAFKARVSSLDMKLTVSYSADGSAWTALATNVAFEATGSSGVKTLNYDIPAGGKYIKFEVAEGSTKPSSNNIKLIIDDVVFTYAEQEGGGETPATTKTIYCSPFDGWHADGARFAIYAFGDGENTAWYDLTLVEGEENVYSADIDVAFPTVIFCRMNGATTENNWDNKWNQTGNLIIPEAQNLYTITGWGETDGAWSVYSAQGGDTPDPVEPTPTEKDSIYFVNVAGWAAPRVHLWGGTAAGTEWPGVEMTKLDDQINNYDVYKYVADKGAYANCLFSDNGAEDKKTADLTWTSGKYFYNDAWYALNEIPAPLPDAVPLEGNIWKVTAETPLVAGSHYINEALLTMDGVYATNLKTNDRTIAGEEFTHAIQVRTDGYPTADKKAGKEKSGSTSLIITAKEDADVTFYYNRQVVGEGGTDNDNKDLIVFDQADITTKIAGVFTIDQILEGNNYMNVTKKVALKKDHTYTVTASGTTLQLHGIKLEAHFPVMQIAGAWNVQDEAWLLNDMSLAEDKLTATYEVELTPGDYEFKMIKDGAWLTKANSGQAYGLHREWPGVAGVIDNASENLKVTADVAGNYVFTWTFANDSIGIAFPDASVVEDPAKFYITGDSALVVDAGLDAEMKWNPAAIKSQKDTFVLSNLKADQYYLLKLTLDGTWNTAKGYGDLTEQTPGLNDVSNDHNIGFKLAEAGSVQVIYIAGETPIFKLVGNFHVDTPVEPTLANGFYLIGQNGWDVTALSADLLFAANPDTEGEYVLNTTLAEGQEIKVVKVENDAIVAWYPAEGANYTVDAAHAGENKDIYFRETYKEDWAAFGGHIWTGSNEEPVVEKYCEKPSGHQANPEFGDPSGRILLTIAKGEGNNIVVKIKNNNEAGNTHTGLNYLWVNAEGATGGVVRYGDGTHAEADVEEVSVIVPFEETRESYNFINIHWAYSGWEGEWAIDGLTVTAAELCEGAAPVEPTLANGFYLIGQNGWDVAALSADLLFAANPDTEGEYVLNTTLAEGQEIKVVKVENDAIVAWYPAEGANYTVDAAHAGENKDIYFRETYKEDWAAFGGYIWTGENEATAISNTAADAEAVKVLNNGMLLIRKGDKTYTIMGQAVK